jgi:FAD/FMN-containing dehydrogenase
LQTLQAKVANWNHLVPIDLGSKGTCMIGGNVATNAG